METSGGEHEARAADSGAERGWRRRLFGAPVRAARPLLLRVVVDSWRNFCFALALLLPCAFQRPAGGLKREKSRSERGGECKILAEVAPEFERRRVLDASQFSLRGEEHGARARACQGGVQGDRAWGAEASFLGEELWWVPQGSLVCSNRRIWINYFNRLNMGCSARLGP